ncbi:GNAT family N-acetyltransferase [Micromonospora sp. PLK6-60]|uniref:GNAT family N-acetyltransferase n=1 Tax=Micromonospora sp. PLK6-60 TaxID=2873383 RepID=UPI001CA62D2F|nr:GNAT family N-acetyltransferase [Micromonospora sp. PLK6-60]MBY8870889.1 GNAT family N-acetyltransferase [Micromonospora sp. PLK6-60]
MTELEIHPRRFDSPEARRLIAATLADLGERYGGDGDETPVDPAEFTPPNGEFLVAYLAGEPVGCGGWRSHGGPDDAAELKRMYTVPAVRGRGVARALLAAIERSARERGRKRVILETGDKQPEAIGLYTSAGYERIPNFGYYKDEPGCLSYGRTL